MSRVEREATEVEPEAQGVLRDGKIDFDWSNNVPPSIRYNLLVEGVQ